MTTPIWVPLVAAGIGSVTTLAGVGVTHLVSGGRFKYEKEERRRQVSREAIADVIARGTDYAGEVNTLIGVAEELLSAADRDAEDWAHVAQAVMPYIESTFPLREPAINAMYRADLVIVDASGVRKELDDYIEALFDVQRLVSHCSDVLAGTEKFDPARGKARMDAFFSALRALTTASRNHIRPQA
ncbi:hypothetical protein [Nocardia beijingensis]